MNVDNISLVINTISNPNVYFNMDCYFEDFDENNMCGTPACIAGHAYFLNNEGKDSCVKDEDVDQSAIDFLGLTRKQADELFYPDRFLDSSNMHIYYTDITRKQAINTLIRLLETGEVDWNKANDK